jgi:PAS domain S-box-containing protein
MDDGRRMELSWRCGRAAGGTRKAAVSAQHIRILCLEDTAGDAESIDRELNRAQLDFSVTRVEDEPSFRAALETSDPDVILAGFNLPRCDGMNAMRIARSLVPDIPFIFVSGSIDEPRAALALREGATDYIMKDRLSRLPSAITRALAERRERCLWQGTQEALRISEERFRYAALAAREVIWDWSIGTGRLTFSDALRSVWGYHLPDGEVTIEWFAERVHPDDRAAILESINAALVSDDRWVGEYRFQRADGTWGVVFDRASIIRDALGKPERMICAMLDISDERRADERLRQSELRFRSVAETASDAIILSEGDGRIVFWNEGATRLFGYEPREMVGQFVERLIPERCREAHREGLERLRRSGEASTGGRMLTLDGLRQDGSEFPLEMTLTIWTSGNDTFCTAVMRDITLRVAGDRQRLVDLTVAKTLAEATSTADVTSRLLRNIGEALGWQAALCWLYDREREQLVCTESWSAPDFAGQQFLDLSRSVILFPGDDLPGRIVLSGRATAADSFPGSGHESGPRSKAARDAGIQRGVGFPIVEHGEIRAVFEFLETRPPIDGDSVLEVMAEAGRRIGDFFDRRRAEERLLRSEASLAEAQETAKLGGFRFDLGTGVVEWSDQIHRIFGVEPGRFEGTYQAYLNYVHPDDLDMVQRLTVPPLPGLSFAFRHRIVNPGGDVCFLHCRFRVTAGTAESPQEIAGTAQDITDQVEAEQTIQRLSRQNDMILNFAAEAILGVDAHRRVIFANPAAAKITGWSVEELLAAPDIHQLIHHSRESRKPYPVEACPLARCLEEARPCSGEETFIRKSGEHFPVQFSCAPMLEGSQVIGWVAIFEDVTERRRLTSQLEQSNRVSGLGRVAATIAHEFNNVLMGIQPFTELIRRRTTDEVTSKAAQQIAGSVLRGKRVTQEILGFTQPSEPAFQPIVVGEWLDQLVPELKSLVSNQVELVVQVPARPILVRGDPAQLQQVLTNLILNSRDAMPAKGTITISVEAGGGDQEVAFGVIPPNMALITIRDTGGGMPPDVLENIFRPLFTTKRTGTGLGLAVAQQVVLRHAGSIHAESKQGEGTTFLILLPMASPAPPVEFNRQEKPRKPRVGRVLLVEDDPAVATGIALLLDVEGIEAHVVARGGDALEAVEAFQPDAVILDISLPDIPGTEVYELIASKYPDLPVLFSSGHSDESPMEHDFGKEHVGFLRKPYDLAALLETLDRITRKPDPVRA